MKNKKKLTAVLLASSLLASSVTAGAAAGMTAANGFDLTGEGALLAEAPVSIQTKQEVSDADIWYNGERVTFKDGVSAKNMDGRVMLPFRSVFELLGADVNYDEKANTVTAVKGDKTVFVDISDSAIYTETNGVRQKIEADVPFVIENDRVLVPVRFVGEAMNVNVGWQNGYGYGYKDGELFEEKGTVYLVDFDRYMQELSENAPNIYRLFTMKMTVPEEYQTSQSGAVLFSYDSDKQDMEEKGTVEIKYTGESRYIDEKTQSNVVIDVEQSGFEKVLQAVSEESGQKIDLNQLKGLTFDVIYHQEVIYFRTNLVSLLTKVLPENEDIKKAAAIANDGMWYSVDLGGMLKNLFGSYFYHQLEPIMSIMKNANNMTAEQALQQMFEAQMENEVTVYAAENINAVFAMYTMLNDSVVFDTEDDENYTVSFTLNKEFIKETAKRSIEQYMDAESEQYQTALAEIETELAPFIYEITAKSTVKNGVAKESSVAMKIGYDDKEQQKEDGYLDILFQMNTEAQTDADGPVEEIVLPENSVDIEFLMDLLTKGTSEEA